jgi:hypothetical protein
MRHNFVIAVCLAAVLGLTGCSRNAGEIRTAAVKLDEANLDAVTDKFYRTPSGADDSSVTYRLLSAKTQNEISAEAWKNISASRGGNSAIPRVLRKKTIQGVTYAAVSYTETVNGKKTIGTATWVLENNTWRRLKLPSAIQAVNAALAKNDCPGVEKSALALLHSDPFSLEAMKARVTCAASQNNDENVVSHRIRDLLAINPDDTSALLTAVRSSVDPGETESYLAKLWGTTAYDEAVDFLVRRTASMRPAADGPDQTEYLIRKIVILGQMKRTAELKKIARDKKEYGRIVTYVTGQQPDVAAEYAGVLGMAFSNAGDPARANEWLNRGMEWDPSNRGVQDLLLKLYDK